MPRIRQRLDITQRSDETGQAIRTIRRDCSSLRRHGLGRSKNIAGGEDSDTSMKPLRILLVEDNVVNQKLAVGVLAKYGHETTLAHHGQEALDILEERSFDLILMDVQMPVMDGLAATREIRQRESLSGVRTPIIAMTAHAMKGDREECMEAGMDDYVPKPIRVSNLLEVFGRVINESASRMVVDVTPDASPGTDVRVADDAAPRLTQTARIECRNRINQEPVDLERALETARGDHQLLNEIVDAFCDESSSLHKRICDAADAADAKQLGIAAHTLKGACGVIGARQLYDACDALEGIGREQRMDELADAMQSYHSAYEKIRQWLAQRSGE